MPHIDGGSGLPGTPGIPKSILSWSGGKDGALALHRVRCEGTCEVTALLTIFTEGLGRISMHGIREELVEQQAASLGLSLIKVTVPFPCPDSLYDERCRSAYEAAKKKGVSQVVFGDVYLEDMRRVHEERLARGCLEAVFPLWGSDTSEMAEEIIRRGFRAKLVCVDTKSVGLELLGQNFTKGLLKRLPAGTDPCGEQGEFHTVVFDGPGFQFPVNLEPGEVTTKQGFGFIDMKTFTPAQVIELPERSQAPFRQLSRS